jgi:hypothetical protein
VIDVSYTIKNGKLVRAERRILTLYHFTGPNNLPGIFENGIIPGSKNEGHCKMTGNVPVVWLTTNPSNLVTDADMARFRSLDRPGLLEMIAEFESGGRRTLHGGNETGSVRLTLSFSKKERNVMPYAEWMVRSRASAEHQQYVREGLGHHYDEFWVCLGTIPVGIIEEVRPVGKATPEYEDAVKQIAAANGGYLSDTNL